MADAVNYTPTPENLRALAKRERVSHNPFGSYMIDGAADEIERLQAALKKIDAGVVDGAFGAVMCNLTYHDIRDIVRGALEQRGNGK